MESKVPNAMHAVTDGGLIKLGLCSGTLMRKAGVAQLEITAAAYSQGAEERNKQGPI